MTEDISQIVVTADDHMKKAITHLETELIKIRAGKATPLDLVETCLANIERWESKVRAWVFVERDYARLMERILEEAKRFTVQWKEAAFSGRLGAQTVATYVWKGAAP